MDRTKIIGSNAYISFPELGISKVLAKVDTGAMSGALHVTNINEIIEDGHKILTFNPLGNSHQLIKHDRYRTKRYRSSNGIVERRYVIDTTMELRGNLYPITISLSNRSKMKKNVLIGRRFLRQNGFIVDVRRIAKYGSRKEQS